MTDRAVIQADFPMTEDIVLLNAGDTQRKGMYVEFGLFPTPDGIDPNGRNPFMDMKGGREHGQRFRVTFHLLGENEECTEDGTEEPAETQAPPAAPQTPEEPERLKGGARAKRAWTELSMPEQAGIFVNDPAFAFWLVCDEWPEDRQKMCVRTDRDLCNSADIVLKRRCGIESKSELGTNADGLAINPDARGVFIKIERAWRGCQFNPSTEALETMLETGP